MELPIEWGIRWALELYTKFRHGMAKSNSDLVPFVSTDPPTEWLAWYEESPRLFINYLQERGVRRLRLWQRSVLSQSADKQCRCLGRHRYKDKNSERQCFASQQAPIIYSLESHISKLLNLYDLHQYQHQHPIFPQYFDQPFVTTSPCLSVWNHRRESESQSHHLIELCVSLPSSTSFQL